MARNVYIETLGCQMNKSDTEKIIGILMQKGYSQTENPKDANLLIINTCSIRAASEDKAYSHLGIWGKWKRTNPDLKICMCGCIAQQTKEKIFRRAPYVDLIFGTHNIDELSKLIDRLDSGEKVCSVYKTPYLEYDDTAPKRFDGINAWLPIIEGCNYFCTYCVVPYTRGRQRSRSPEIIIEEARQIAKEGFKEITLLGQTVDSYGKDFEDKSYNLAYLLREISKIDGILRIRFLTSHPVDMDDSIIDAVKELPKVCEYFHIPMQSGSTDVLKRMKRGYTRDEYIELFNKIRNEIPDVAITSDFIAGFPGETQEQFDETLSIMEELQFDYSNTAAYSQRRQTPAAVWKDQVPQRIKKERLQLLNKKVKETTRKSNDRYLGRTLEILVEGYSEDNGVITLNGRTRNNKVTHFVGDKSLMGTLVNVKILESSMWCLKGKIV